MKVVAVILSYNCASMLPRALERIPRDVVDEIILTDDGSSDGSFDVAQRLGIRAWHHHPNRGYGGNLKEGLRHALALGADYVVEVHGDGAQFDPAAARPAMRHMAEGADLILGSRFVTPGKALADGMPRIRYTANRFLSFFDRLVLGLPLTEFHTGFRIYGRGLLDKVAWEQNADDYLFSFQIIAQAAYHGCTVREVEVTADYHAEHTSHHVAGASVYALKTFGVLGSYALARAGLLSPPLFRKRPAGQAG